MHKHNKLRAERKSWALDQAEIAALIGISPGSLHKFERAHRRPGTLEVAIGLELALGKSLAELYPRLAGAMANRIAHNAGDLSARLEFRTGPVAERKREFLGELAERLHNALEA
ncbi:helix-turn-helix transcriptional regulator [Sphingomonas sp.]|uniref:helix-turn-helix domain-containing protein n=1 Tax=Sphingomonas sp. TaxID=28214 RepID=UPI001B163482|nr:helix-turn-helix transcriptional regulator [Sphingomonas sp.]MBO9714261.1 helix-turn-helix transcriptional regulator [Sphingomonas sp.]